MCTYEIKNQKPNVIKIEIDKIKEVLRKALLNFDSELSSFAADYVVDDILESVDLEDPNLVAHGLTWVAEHFYASHYLHAGWF